MATGINFAQQTSLYQEKEKHVAIMKGTVVAVFLLIAVVGAYGGVYFFEKSQVDQLASVNAQIGQEVSSRNYGELAETLDAASRLNFAEEISRRQNSWGQFLTEMNSLLLPSTSITTFDGSASYLPESEAVSDASGMMGTSLTEESFINLTLVSKSLEDVSKQVLALKSSPRIQSAIIHGIVLEETGVNFRMDIIPKEHAFERGTFVK